MGCELVAIKVLVTNWSVAVTCVTCALRGGPYQSVRRCAADLRATHTVANASSGMSSALWSSLAKISALLSTPGTTLDA